MALGIFEQTFQATNALSVIGLAVAFAGLLLGLLSIFDESTQTWQTLKQLGFSSYQFVLSAGLEGAGIGLSSWAAGAIAGLGMGWLLIFVINVQSFGWTLLWKVPVESFLLFGLFINHSWICLGNMFSRLLEILQKMKRIGLFCIFWGCR